jgi:hypothetical protein
MVENSAPVRCALGKLVQLGRKAQPLSYALTACSVKRRHSSALLLNRRRQIEPRHFPSPPNLREQARIP